MTARVVAFDALPQPLRKQRDAIRKMMVARCTMPDSPIPLPIANRVGDWVTMLVAYRANVRRKAGKQPFPDQQTLQADIAASAEAIELLFIVMAEEADPPSPLVIAK